MHDSSLITAARADALRAAVLAWAPGAHRDLPWRRTRDAWAVLVSEAMLQQTQVARVVPRWREFLERFPTPAACASAPVGDVVRSWAGLGYNRRAVQLHAAATACVREHGGEVPDTLTALRALPGVGPYTARAVLAFAHEHDAAVLDTNVARIVARAVAGRPLRPSEAQQLADLLLPTGHAWTWNQAMLDLGAGVCTKRSPRCHECPIASMCTWRVGDDRRADPAIGSAGVSAGQSRFEGSDRQGRGRLVDALRAGEVQRSSLASVCGWPDEPDRAQRAAEGLVRDGLATWRGDTLTLR